MTYGNLNIEKKKRYELGSFTNVFAEPMWFICNGLYSTLNQPYIISMYVIQTKYLKVSQTKCNTWKEN